MGLLDTYRINKAIDVLLTSQDAASAETMQAMATLKRLGQSAIPKGDVSKVLIPDQRGHPNS